MKQPPIISVDEFTSAQNAGRLSEVWNVLSDEYFTDELIPGSRHVPVDRVAREVTETGLSKETPIAVYCSGPTCPNSKTAGEKLATLGFTNVSVFEGGLEAWRKAGYTLEQTSAAA